MAGKLLQYVKNSKYVVGILSTLKTKRSFSHSREFRHYLRYISCMTESNIVMGNPLSRFESEAIRFGDMNPQCWLRYVNDIFVI